MFKKYLSLISLSILVFASLTMGCREEKTVAVAVTMDTEISIQDESYDWSSNDMRFKARRAAIDYAVKKHPSHVPRDVSLLPGAGGRLYYAMVRTSAGSDKGAFVTTECAVRPFFEHGTEAGQKLKWEMVATPIDSFPPSVYSDITKTVEAVGGEESLNHDAGGYEEPSPEY